jgi:hypothetical protein
VWLWNGGVMGEDWCEWQLFLGGMWWRDALRVVLLIESLFDMMCMN